MLRLGDVKDLGELVRIEDACFREGRFQRGQLRWILRNPTAVTLVEDTGRGLAGVVMLLFETRACRVLSVAVVASYRRRGLATTMMRTAERVAVSRGSPGMRLEVSTRNLAAIELYRTLGYKVDGHLPGYYSWGDDAYSMSKLLEGVRAPSAVSSEAAATPS
ncbi:MAG: GNAT family N-acetyltransferase [Methanobacteriota archaeon]